MSIQMYGQWADYNSFSGVSRAISRMIRQRRMNGAVYGVGQRNPTYLHTYLPVGLDNTAGIGIYVGYPELAPSWLTGHDQKILVTVCETDRIPSSWVAACNQMDLVIVPSQWCKDAFERSGVKIEVNIVRHGVDRTIDVRSATASTPYPLFLHVSGSLTFAGRKGTVPLLRAFKEFLSDWPTAKLWLKVPPTDGYNKVLRALALEDNVWIMKEESLSPWDMAGVYSAVTAVVQPSRAEGFGLVPLEARCVGTPIILTDATGHREYFDTRAGDTLVETGRSTLLDTQMNPVGSAPTVSYKAIYESLRTFMSMPGNLDRSVSWANEFREQWSWENTLAPLARALKERYSARSSAKLGAKSSLRGA